MADIPITTGSGQASVAAETVAGISYQKIEVYGGGGASVMTVNADGSTNNRIQGSIAVAIISGSIAVTSSGTANQSVSGTVGASIIGLTPVVFTNSSVLSIPQGSLITVWQTPSIAGTYQEDTAHTTGDRGLLNLGVRNDTLTSVTSTDNDYSLHAVGSAGEMVVANAPFTKWVQGTADLRGNIGGSVTVIGAQGASIFTYVTGVQVANMGSASVLVTFSGATSSIIGYTIAPAGGGSNIPYLNGLKTNANGAFTASISGQASVLVSAQGFISKT